MERDRSLVFCDGVLQWLVQDTSRSPSVDHCSDIMLRSSISRGRTNRILGLHLPLLSEHCLARMRRVSSILRYEDPSPSRPSPPPLGSCAAFTIRLSRRRHSCCSPGRCTIPLSADHYSHVR